MLRQRQRLLNEEDFADSTKHTQIRNTQKTANLFNIKPSEVALLNKEIISENFSSQLLTSCDKIVPINANLFSR
jgi:hypothetical protein